MKYILTALQVGTLVLLAACASAPTSTSDQRQASDREAVSDADASTQKDMPNASDDSDDELREPAKYELFEGDHAFFNPGPISQRPSEDAGDGEIVFNFEGQPVQEVVKAILGDLLQANYVIAPGIGGNVTFSTAEPVRMDQVMPILEMLLSWNNAALVYIDGRYHVVPTAQAIKGQLTPTVAPLAGQRGYEVRIFPLQFIAPTEMEKLLAPYARDGAVISVDNFRGLLVLAGNRQELENYQRTIETFDVDWLAGMSVGIFPIERVEADTVVTELESIFGEGAGTPLAGMFRFMSIERLNAVLVITPQADYLEKAAEWVARLDRGGSEAGVRLYVYLVKNVKATDLADTLNDVFGGGSSSSGGSSRRRNDRDVFAPGLEVGEITSINDPRQQRQQRQDQAQNQQSEPSRPSADGGLALVESDDIRITAVEETNALLVRATPQQYDAVLGAIKRLDTVPLQVLVEVMVLEVTLNDELAYGVQWFFENAVNSGALQGFFGDTDPGPPDSGGGTGNPGNVNPGTGNRRFRIFDSGASVSGDRFGVINNQSGVQYAILGGDVGAVIDLLEGATELQALAAPAQMVLNNREATINVGTQIPVNSPVFNTGVGSQLATTRVQFRDTGVTVSVTPRVNPGGMVFMELSLEVSNIVPDSADSNGNVAVNRRQFDTEVAVQSSETIVLGGLIQAQESNSQQGVPVLAKIPVLGGLFGRQGKESLRTELMVLITPSVVDSIESARAVSTEYRSKMRAIKPIDIDTLGGRK